jgi:hypothetical protein
VGPSGIGNATSFRVEEGKQKAGGGLKLGKWKAEICVGGWLAIGRKTGTGGGWIAWNMAKAVDNG